jgi:hypothetical protein
MQLRRLVVLIGIIAVIVGISQIIITHRVEVMTKHYIAGSSIYLLAAVSLLFGIILAWAGATRHVRLFRLILVIGVLMIIAGLFIGILPGMSRELIYTFYFNKPESTRKIIAWAGGLIRILLGTIIIYAGMHPPIPRTPRLGSIVPLA